MRLQIGIGLDLSIGPFQVTNDFRAGSPSPTSPETDPLPSSSEGSAEIADESTTSTMDRKVGFTIPLPISQPTK